MIDHLAGDLEGHIVDGAAGDTGLLRGVAHFLRHHVGIAQIGEADGQAHGVAEGQNLLQVLICESLYKTHRCQIDNDAFTTAFFPVPA